MTRIGIEQTGTIDGEDAMFGQPLVLPDGRLLCSVTRRAGMAVRDTVLWTSGDGGRHWTPAGSIGMTSVAPYLGYSLRIGHSGRPGGLLALGARYTGEPDAPFGQKQTSAVYSRSDDAGLNWGAVNELSVPFPGAVEVAHSVLALPGGRVLAAVASIPEAGRLGEEVVVRISPDAGVTWPETATVFRDPDGKIGFFETKLACLQDGRLLATAWAVTLTGVVDQPNVCAFSADQGRTWSRWRAVGIAGQTLTAIPHRDGRVLILFNRRHGRVGVVAGLVDPDRLPWCVESETMIYDPIGTPAAQLAGPERVSQLGFGYPMGVGLGDIRYLVTWWQRSGPVRSVRWARVRLES